MNNFFTIRSWKTWALLLLVSWLWSCQRQQIRNDLIGFWVFEEAGYCEEDSCVREAFSGLTCDGFKFMEESVCRPVWFGNQEGSNELFHLDTRDQFIGSWSVKKSSITLDWGDSYIVSGTFDLDLKRLDENIIYIDGTKFVRRDFVMDMP